MEFIEALPEWYLIIGWIPGGVVFFAIFSENTGPSAAEATVGLWGGLIAGALTALLWPLIILFLLAVWLSVAFSGNKPTIFTPEMVWRLQEVAQEGPLDFDRLVKLSLEEEFQEAGITVSDLIAKVKALRLPYNTPPLKTPEEIEYENRLERISGAYDHLWEEFGAVAELLEEDDYETFITLNFEFGNFRNALLENNDKTQAGLRKLGIKFKSLVIFIINAAKEHHMLEPDTKVKYSLKNKTITLNGHHLYYLGN